MREKIDVFLPCGDVAVAEATIEQLERCGQVQTVTMLCTEGLQPQNRQYVSVDNLQSTATVSMMARRSEAAWVLIVTRPGQLLLGQGAVERLLTVAVDSRAAMVYADRYEQRQQADGQGKAAGVPAFQSKHGIGIGHCRIMAEILKAIVRKAQDPEEVDQQDGQAQDSFPCHDHSLRYSNRSPG